MKVIKEFGGDALWGVLPYIQTEFDKLSDENSEEAFFNGVSFIYNKDLRNKYKDYKRRVLFAHWSPCEFMRTKDYFHFDAYDYFTDVYCVCPFTCKFMNDYFGEEKFKYISYPYTNYSVNSFGNYDGTVCSWFGSIHGQDHISAIETLMKFKYKFITSQQNTWMRHPYEYNKCTHVNISTPQKLIEVSKGKSSLTFNKLYNNSRTVNNANYKNIHHDAFDYFSQGILPQFKVRTHETATCKSLILAYKDQWNLIEDFYEPNKHFIYFETFSELEDILHDVDKNFDKYLPIIDNAFEEVKKYSVEKMFEYMRINDKNLVTWKNKNYNK